MITFTTEVSNSIQRHLNNIPNFDVNVSSTIRGNETAAKFDASRQMKVTFFFVSIFNMIYINLKDLRVQKLNMCCELYSVRFHWSQFYVYHVDICNPLFDYIKDIRKSTVLKF